jgi:hypothetical protein
MTDYSKLEYWEDRYDDNPDPFDWYQIYSTIKEKLQNFIKQGDRILIIGAGSSCKKIKFFKKLFTISTQRKFIRRRLYQHNKYRLFFYNSQSYAKSLQRIWI